MKRIIPQVVLFVLLLTILSYAAAAPNQVEKKVFVKGDSKAALGVAIMDPDQEALDEYKLDGGATIKDVLEDSEAERIGLKKDDIIVKFAGQSVKNAKELRDLAAEIDAEKTVEIVVNRQGKSITFKAHLVPGEPRDVSFAFGDEDFDFDFGNLPDKPFPHGKMFKKWKGDHSEKGGYLGVVAENLSEQLLDYFEVEQGVLIEKVIKEGPAEKAGLKAGDVITAINKKAVKDYSDLIRILNYYDPDDEVTVKYSRKGSKRDAKVVLGKKQGSLWFGSDDSGDFHKIMVDVGEKLDGDLKVHLEKLRDIEDDLKDLDIVLYII